IPKPGKVRLNIYNFLGKNISSLVDEFQNPGSYTISFDAKNLASGIYFYELKLGNHSEIRKMILLH
ncbi:MAG: T9SS type A sorting domain-containing protein, partial [bacterium]|nr:T9SS type A sorting domain-containing protein [bacterium]